MSGSTMMSGKRDEVLSSAGSDDAGTIDCRSAAPL